MDSFQRKLGKTSSDRSSELHDVAEITRRFIDDFWRSPLMKLEIESCVRWNLETRFL